MKFFSAIWNGPGQTETETHPRSNLVKGLVVIFAGIVCLFFGEVYAAQILAMLGLYRIWIVLPASLLLAAAAFYIYFRWGPSSSHFFANQPDEQSLPQWLNFALYAAGAVLIFVLVILPVATWPYSPINQTLHWDAGAYHFPKAVELFKSGNVWDLSIPYGEFPFGYESMLAFGLLITHNEALFGTIHALTALLVFLSIWLLSRRYTRLPGGLLFFLCASIFLSEMFTVKNNPFYIFLDQADMVGKNDLFLAAGVLAALVHAPFGRSRPSSSAHLPGLVYATLLVLATKPAGMFAVSAFWLPLLWNWLNSWRSTHQFPWRKLTFSAVLIVPGGFWAIRNLFIIKTIFPEGVWVMNDWSIANNLTNPFFYAHLPRNFTFLLVVVFLGIGFTLWKKASSWRTVAPLVILLIAFAFTPEGAFQKTTQEPTRIAWRLGIALVGCEWVALLVLFEPIIAWVMRGLTRPRLAQIGLILALCAFSAWMLWDQRGRLRQSPLNAILLYDEFRKPVGTQGYHSAYDYVEKNIRNSVIEIDGGIFYYMYGSGYTNRPTKLQYPLGRETMVPQLRPDYYVVIHHGGKFNPSPQWLQKWALQYQDPQGAVFKRVN